MTHVTEEVVTASEVIQMAKEYKSHGFTDGRSVLQSMKFLTDHDKRPCNGIWCVVWMSRNVAEAHHLVNKLLGGVLPPGVTPADSGTSLMLSNLWNTYLRDILGAGAPGREAEIAAEDAARAAAALPIRDHHFDVGDSGSGPIGLCAVVKARTKEEAVEILRGVLPSEIAVGHYGTHSTIDYIRVFFNVANIDTADIDMIGEETVPESERVKAMKSPPAEMMGEMLGLTDLAANQPIYVDIEIKSTDNGQWFLVATRYVEEAHPQSKLIEKSPPIATRELAVETALACGRRYQISPPQPAVTVFEYQQGVGFNIIRQSGWTGVGRVPSLEKRYVHSDRKPAPPVAQAAPTANEDRLWPAINQWARVTGERVCHNLPLLENLVRAAANEAWRKQNASVAEGMQEIREKMCELKGAMNAQSKAKDEEIAQLRADKAALMDQVRAFSEVNGNHATNPNPKRSKKL